MSKLVFNSPEVLSWQTICAVCSVNLENDVFLNSFQTWKPASWPSQSTKFMGFHVIICNAFVSVWSKGIRWIMLLYWLREWRLIETEYWSERHNVVQNMSIRVQPFCSYIYDKELSRLFDFTTLSSSIQVNLDLYWQTLLPRYSIVTCGLNLLRILSEMIKSLIPHVCTSTVKWVNIAKQWNSVWGNINTTTTAVICFGCFITFV